MRGGGRAPPLTFPLQSLAGGVAGGLLPWVGAGAGKVAPAPGALPAAASWFRTQPVTSTVSGGGGGVGGWGSSPPPHRGR